MAKIRLQIAPDIEFKMELEVEGIRQRLRARCLQGKYRRYACIACINGLIPKIHIARFRL